jgi:glycosyltransferase involved in cell wall biosynthesis
LLSEVRSQQSEVSGKLPYRHRQWICVQNGAREHYAVPRALKQSGRLDALFTEIWAGQPLRQLACGPWRAVAQRYHRGLDGEDQKSKVQGQKAEIISWNVAALWRNVRSSLLTNHSLLDASHARFILDGRWFSEKVRDYIVRRGMDVCGKVIFSYDTTALELFQWAKAHGAFCVLCQMDPARVESELVREEEHRWPGWVLHPTEVPDAYFQRREEEWQLADRIIVNSRWSFAALVNQSVPKEKLLTIPLCYEGSGTRSQESESRRMTSDFRSLASHPLRVLFLGQVILRKGIQYLIEAAKLLRDEPVHFDVVGPIGISETAMNSAPPNMTFHGRANRGETAGWYSRADVFVLPTISDGFAITQIEAMAHGLPVIATPNCGEVVTDCVDGFIVPARDSATLAESIRRCLAEPGQLRIRTEAARKKVEEFSLAKLAGRLLDLENELTRHV